MASFSSSPFQLEPPGATRGKPSKKRPRPDNNDNKDHDSGSSSCTSAPPFTILSANNRKKYAKRNSYIKCGQQTSRAPWFDFYEFEAVGSALLTAITAATASSSSPGSGCVAVSQHQQQQPCPSPDTHPHPAETKEVSETTTQAQQDGEISDNTDVYSAPDNTGTGGGGGIGMSIEEAFEKVAVWRCRCPQQKLPHAIESTFALAQVLWRDYDPSATTTTMELSLGYSAAIIRSINGLVDVLQQSRAVAASIAHLATTQLGLPLWLVNIRHEATHNQLPSLPLLRLAASTLLEYFQSTYWDPIIQQRKEYWEQAVSLLDQYRNTALGRKNNNYKNKSSSTKGSSSVSNLNNKAPSECINDYAAGNSNDDDDNEEEGEDDDLAQNGVLGTSFNRFAVLQKSSKSHTKKKSKKGTVKAAKNEEGSAVSEEEKAPSSSAEPPLSIARRYVKLKIPVDVAYGAALSCLVWGDSSVASSSSDPLLLPSSVEEYPETEKGFRKLQKRCFPLLSVIGVEWPGSVSALLIHIVDSILLAEDTPVQDGSLQYPEIRRKLFFFGSWVEYLVSTGFLTFFINRKVSNNNQAGFEQDDQKQDFTLQQLSKVIGYPIASLIDRCTSSWGCNNNPHSTSRRLVEIFERVLSVKHAPIHGAVTSPGINKHSLLEEKMARSAELVMNGGGTTDCSRKFTLDEMEAMLGDKGGGSTSIEPPTASIPKDDIFPNPTSPRTAWVRCKSWEPCAIGTLPGYPL